jgi:Putative Actinobacterial Holin-X, holin superfamily III
VTQAPDPTGGLAPARGIRASTRRVVAHVRAIVQLEQELAKSELQRKGTSIGAGAGVGVAAGIFALFAIGFGLAAAAAALALVVDWWLALLIVFLFLVVLVVVLALVARTLVQRGMPLAPEKAIAEAKLSKQILRENRAG